jgi:hypothetical protein
MPCRTGMNCGLSPRCPAVSTIGNGFCPCSQPRCSFVVRPPRSDPTRGRPAPARHRRAVRPPDPPFAGTGRVLVRPSGGGVHAHIPADPPGRVRQGRQPSQHPLPGAVPLPPAEQAHTPPTTSHTPVADLVLDLQPPLVPAQRRELPPFLAGQTLALALVPVGLLQPVPQNDSENPKPLASCPIGWSFSQASSTAR